MDNVHGPMPGQKELLLIIPAYNEVKSLPQVVEAVKQLPFCDYIVINDGSSDGTGALCADKSYHCLNLPVNLGLAGALQTGFRYAAQCGYALAAQIDADGQHLAECIAPLLAEIKKGRDIVIGSRNLGGGKTARTARGIGSGALSAAIRITTGQRITDATSGMRMYNHKMIRLLSQSINLGPEPDTIAYLIRSGATVCEVGVQMRERTAGKSYLTAINAVAYMLRMVLSILIVQFVRKKIDLRNEGTP
jgi:glycosyltransferase involved in cell wall biosynthesis